MTVCRKPYIEQMRKGNLQVRSPAVLVTLKMSWNLKYLFEHAKTKRAKTMKTSPFSQSVAVIDFVSYLYFGCINLQRQKYIKQNT